jgi:N-acetyl-alpha-D-muramate 1-phosphate uridylyltransferase
MSAVPGKAMVLAAGLGTRMRPLTDKIPKPLVEIAGRSMLDRGLDALAAAGVREAVVNVHHLADQVEAHLAGRTDIATTVSDERERLLDSAGGIVKALPALGPDPFFILNADTFWLETGSPALAMMAEDWDDAGMDILLLLARMRDATGHGSRSDFRQGEDGRLVRSGGAEDGFIYAGAAILHPRIFAGALPEPHSLNLYFDRAIAAGRLFGTVLSGHWITVGTVAAIAEAEAAVARHQAA